MNNIYVLLYILIYLESIKLTIEKKKTPEFETNPLNIRRVSKTKYAVLIEENEVLCDEVKNLICFVCDPKNVLDLILFLSFEVEQKMYRLIVFKSKNKLKKEDILKFELILNINSEIYSEIYIAKCDDVEYQDKEIKLLRWNKTDSFLQVEIDGRHCIEKDSAKISGIFLICVDDKRWFYCKDIFLNSKTTTFTFDCLKGIEIENKIYLMCMFDSGNVNISLFYKAKKNNRFKKNSTKNL